MWRHLILVFTLMEFRANKNYKLNTVGQQKVCIYFNIYSLLCHDNNCIMVFAIFHRVIQYNSSICCYLERAVLVKKFMYQLYHSSML